MAPERSEREALAFAAFSAVLDQHLATLRQALAEEHRRLRGEEPAAVEAPTFDHYFALREEVANVQPTVPRAPPELADWPDEPEAPPDTPDVSPRSAFLLRRNLSAEKSAFKDPSRSRSSDIMKKVTFLEHIQLCEYPVPDTGEPLRALWKWPDENEPDQEEELMSEMQLPGGATGDVNLSRFDHTLRFFVMLPLSRRRLAWDTIALLILAIEVITFPLSTFEELEVVMTTNAAFMTMDWISAIYWLADMPLQLFAGYNTYEGKVEKRFSRTSWRYFKTWFFLDLIIVSLDWITLIGQYDGEFLETLRVGKSVRGVRILRGIRILRLAKLAPVIQHFSDSLKSDMALLMWKLTVVVLSALVMNHFIGCFWYWLGNITGQDGLPSWTKEAQMEQRGAAYQYVAALHWSLSNFAIATSRFHAVNELEHIFAIFVLLFGLICFASCLSAIAQAVSAYYAQESGVIQNEKTLRTFLGDRSISPQMCNRIWEFMRGRRRNRTRFTEQDVQLLQNLPKVLRVELRKDMFLPLLLHHPLFQGLELADPHVIAKICDRGLEFRGVPPMEDLFARAERAAFMYYVIGGSLQYHMLRPHPRRSNTAAIQVQPGEWVSEGALWFENWVHFGWLRAKTACEFLLVNVEVFQAVAMKSPSPYLGSTIYKQAWVKRIKEDVRKQEDGVTRLLLGRPSDLSGDRQIAEHIAADAFPDLAKKYDRLLHPSLAPFRSFSSSRTAVAG